MPDNGKKDLHLFCDLQYDENKNKVILEATISYINNFGRFTGSLFQCFVTDWFPPLNL